MKAASSMGLSSAWRLRSGLAVEIWLPSALAGRNAGMLMTIALDGSLHICQ